MIVLSLVSFFNDLASDMVIPLIPILLTTQLAVGPLALGAVEGIADSVASFLKLWSGRHSDWLGGRRKTLTVLGYSLSNIARPLLGTAGTWPEILALRSADRVGKGIRSAPRDAMLADCTPPLMRGLAFGFHRALDNAGAVGGALAAAAVLAWSSELLDLHRHEVTGLAAPVPAGRHRVTGSLDRSPGAPSPRAGRRRGARVVRALRRRPRRDSPSVAKTGAGRIDTDPPPRGCSRRWAALLDNLSQAAPVVVMLDDVHLADGSSWEALNHLARNLRDSPDLPPPDAARPVELGEHRIATEIVHGLEQDGLLTRRTLGPLNRDDLRSLAGRLVRPGPGRRAAGGLARSTAPAASPSSPRACSGPWRTRTADLDNPALRSLPEDLAQRVPRATSSSSTRMPVAAGAAGGPGVPDEPGRCRGRQRPASGAHGRDARRSRLAALRRRDREGP